MSAPNHISSSQLNLYLSCGEAYRRRYIDGTILPPGIAIVRGKSGHAALEVNNKQKIETRKDLPESDFKDAISDSIKNQFESGIALTDEEAKVGMKKIKAKLTDELTDMSSLLVKSAKTIQPVSVETRQEIFLEKLNKSIVYVMDVEGEDESIVDYKFTGRKKTDLQVSTDGGLTTYALAYRIKNGKMPKRIMFHNFVSGKKGNELHFIPAERSESDLLAIYNRYGAAIKGIEAGIFAPAELGHWKCSEKWCGYFNSCPYVNSERRDAQND